LRRLQKLLVYRFTARHHRQNHLVNVDKSVDQGRFTGGIVRQRLNKRLWRLFKRWLKLLSSPRSGEPACHTFSLRKIVAQCAILSKPSRWDIFRPSEENMGTKVKPVQPTEFPRRRGKFRQCLWCDGGQYGSYTGEALAASLAFLICSLVDF
jgi:hypothetical protein